MKCRRDNKPPTFLIITPVFRGVPARKEGGYFARRHDLSLSLSFFLLRVSLPPPDTLMSLSPSPPFTLPFRAFLFDLHPIATATQQLFLLFFPLLPRWPPLFRFFLCSPDHCLERAEARRWRAQEMPSNVRHDAEPCPFPCSTRSIAAVSRACFLSRLFCLVVLPFSIEGTREFSEGICVQPG